MHFGELGFRDLALRPPGEIRPDRPERMNPVVQRVAEGLEPLARLLETHQRDERAKNLVGPLEDEIDARVAHGLLVRELLGVTDAARDLERFVRGAKGELRSEDLA